MPKTDPEKPATGEQRRRPKDEDAGTKAVEDVKDFFMAHGEEDSPTSDSGAQPPG